MNAHEAYTDHMENIRRLLTDGDNPEVVEEIGEIWEYGLSFEYHPASEHRPRGGFRWLLTFGGPNIWIEFETEDPEVSAEYLGVSYHHRWWGDCFEFRIEGEDLDLLRDHWRNLVDCGVPQAAMEKVALAGGRVACHILRRRARP